MGFSRRRQRLSFRGFGQSLMEAIIASGIVATSIASALTLVQSSISASRESEASIVAGNLAREGIEVVRAIRDSNWLAGDPWDDGLASDPSPLDHTGVPILDTATGSWSIKFEPNTMADAYTRIYRYISGENVGLHVNAAAPPPSSQKTPYSRLVTLDPICGDPARTVVPSGSSCAPFPKIGIRATSRVDWIVTARNRHLEVVEDLYDWR